MGAMRQAITPKQRRFVEEYLIDHNGAQAAIRAGYSPKCARETAYKLLTKSHIANAVRQGSRAVSQRLGITRESILEGLLEAAAMAKSAGEVLALVSAWREVAKLLSLYPTKRLEVHTDGAGERQLKLMSDAELKRCALGLMPGPHRQSIGTIMHCE